MADIILGSTGIRTDRNAFGALPIQRVTMQEAVNLFHKAYAGGITFYDTARAYTDSEAKLGQAFSRMRDKIFIASKTQADTPVKFWQHLDNSLAALKTDYIDIYQFHNPRTCYKPGDGTGMYECMLEAVKQGKIRNIGLTSHKLSIANDCIDSGYYATLQFPFSYLSSDIDIELAAKCARANMGFIAMKALSGGIITDAKAAYAFIAQFSHILPIWGIQRESELDEFLACSENSPEMTADMKSKIEKDRQELVGEFCRGCGYCLPCPSGIAINICARMSLLIKRSPEGKWLTPAGQDMMRKIEDCTECGQCISKCPYGLQVPELLQKNYQDYEKYFS